MKSAHPQNVPPQSSGTFATPIDAATTRLATPQETCLCTATTFPLIQREFFLFARSRRYFLVVPVVNPEPVCYPPFPQIQSGRQVAVEENTRGLAVAQRDQRGFR